MSKFKVGQPVRVVGIEKTRKYGTNEIMHDMVNNSRSYDVEACDNSSVKVNGFFWHPDDIESADLSDPIKEEKIFHFDSNFLS